MKVPLLAVTKSVWLGVALVALGVVLLGLGLHGVDGYSMLVMAAGVALVTAGVRDLGDAPPAGIASMLSGLDTPANRATVAALARDVADQIERGGPKPPGGAA